MRPTILCGAKASIDMSFDLNNPPAEPPADCLEPDKWREAYAIYIQHQPGKSGRCLSKRCGERWPCLPHRPALRALMDACTPKQAHEGFLGPGRIITRATCRWCHEQIERHSIWGWLHVEGGFILCQRPKPGMPPLTSAEPGTGTSRPPPVAGAAPAG
jgi:hypothetical protein